MLLGAARRTRGRLGIGVYATLRWSVRIVMTLLVRDEADIIDAQIAFHLNAGVDFVIAMDHLSNDGTTEILRWYEQEGVLHLIRQEDPVLREAQWVTEIARLAATEFDADWVINADADEFWWPRARSLKEIFMAVPDRYGVVYGMWRNFAPRLGSGEFYEKMIVRIPSVPLATGSTIVNWVSRKAAHRGDPLVVIGSGKHDAQSDRLRPVRTWFPIEVLHFPIRSERQSERKLAYAHEWYEGELRLRGTHREEGLRSLERGKMNEYYSSLVVDDATLDAAVRAGEAFVDTRVRDVLRALRRSNVRGCDDGGSRFRVTDAVPLPEAPMDRAFVSDVGILAELDSCERVVDRVGALESRVATLGVGCCASR